MLARYILAAALAGIVTFALFMLITVLGEATDRVIYQSMPRRTLTVVHLKPENDPEQPSAGDGVDGEHGTSVVLEKMREQLGIQDNPAQEAEGAHRK